MDETVCAGILWATTARLSATPGNEQTLTAVRHALAEMLLAGATAGFPAPLRPDAAERATPAWKDCVDAARAATAARAGPAPPPPPSYALLARADGAAGARPAADIGLAWPASSAPARSLGPLKAADGGDVWLFLYDRIDDAKALLADGDAGAGLFPRGVAVGAPVAPAAGSAAGPARGRATSRDKALAIALFCLSVLLGTASMVWIYAAADFARGAAGEMLYGTRIDGRNSEPVVQADMAGQAVRYKVIETQWVDGVRQRKPNGRDASNGACLDQVDRPGDPALAPDSRLDCAYSWSIAWANQRPVVSRTSDAWIKTLDLLWGPTNLRGKLSLLWPLVLSAISILTLIFSAGLALEGRPFGALIDERNRLSLSRAQQLAWTIVLFAGFTVLGVFNIALLADGLRDAGQLAELGDATGETIRLFPSMDPTLWAVLGITVAVGPYLSRRLQTQTPAGAVGGGVDMGEASVIPPGQRLVEKDSTAEAAWSDLFKGEREADANHVDVSRLQHLVITGLLLGSYIILLVQFVRSIDGMQVLLALTKGAAVFTDMPPVSGEFVALLVLSHGAYLAFKTLPAGAGSGVRS